MATVFQDIKQSLRRLYLDDARPWLVGFSGSLGMANAESRLANGQTPSAFDSRNSQFDTTSAVQSVPPEQRTKPVTVLCTDTRRRKSG